MKSSGAGKSPVQWNNITYALADEGKVYASNGNRWFHLSSLDGLRVDAHPASPAFMHEILKANKNDALRSAYKTGLNTVLKGVDGKYLFV